MQFSLEVGKMNELKCKRSSCHARLTKPDQATHQQLIKKGRSIPLQACAYTLLLLINTPLAEMYLSGTCIQYLPKFTFQLQVLQLTILIPNSEGCEALTGMCVLPQCFPHRLRGHCPGHSWFMCLNFRHIAATF